MVRSPSKLVLTLAVGLLLAAPAAAVERTTDAERSYLAIRDSIDPASQVLARRWYSLVKLQEWTDSSRRFKTRAKYVEHDPELAWVKLRVVQGVGDERVVKDIQVPVDKLSAVCRSRVRQIAVLSDKVIAAVAAEEEKEDDEAAGAVAEERFDTENDRRGGRADERGLTGRGAAERGAPPGPVESEARPARRPSRRKPLPAMLPPLPGGAIRSAISAPAAAQPSAPDTAGSTEFKHPATAAELRDVFAQAFSAGDKATLEKLVYWADTSPEQRRVTYSSLLDYAGARLTRCDIVEQEGGEAVTDYTVNYATVLDIGFETRTADIEMNWPIGEIGGKYYLGAWAYADEQQSRR